MHQNVAVSCVTANQFYSIGPRGGLDPAVRQRPHCVREMPSQAEKLSAVPQAARQRPQPDHQGRVATLQVCRKRM